MGGRRTTKAELAQLEGLTKEGLTARDIARKLDRSPAAIRNLRYKKHLVTRTRDESKALFQQRDELSNIVKGLQGQKTVLTYELNCLRAEKERLEAAILANRALLQETLAQKLIVLKIQRPDLFTISDQEQIAKLVGEFLKWILA
jgi:DNA-binding CsgD family transcriptional regulator